VGHFLIFFTVFFCSISNGWPAQPKGNHLPSGSLADIERARMDPIRRMQEILSRRNSSGEPGEKIAAFQGSLSSAVSRARDGQTEEFHDVLDTVKGGDLTSTECGDAEYLIQNHFLKDESSAKIKEVLELRKIPTRELYKDYTTKGPERQKEWWRRVRSLVSNSNGLFTEAQMNHLVSSYISMKEDGEFTPGQRAKLIGSLLTTGIDPELIKNFTENLATSSAFPCGESLTTDLFTAGEMIGNSTKRLSERWSHPLFLKLAELEAKPFGRMFRQYLLANPDPNGLVMAVQHSIPDGDPLEEKKNEETKRQRFLSSLGNREDNRNPHMPTFGEYLDLQKAQVSNERLSKPARAKAAERLRAAIDYFTFADRNGARYLMMDGKKVALTSYSDKRREDFVPILEVEKDLPILQGLTFKGKKVAAPSLAERSGPPPTKEQNDYHVYIERENLKFFPMTDIEKEDLKRIWNRRWAKAAELYKVQYGEAPPAGLFPEKPHAPAVAAAPAATSQDLQAILNRLDKLEKENARLRSKVGE